jgi:Protein of unknown function (DUF4232)
VRSRLVLPVLVLAAVAALATSASAGGSAPACRASQLHGKQFDENGAAGTILLSITLTNKGKYCSLKGYARLQLMASARRTLPTHVSHGGLALLNPKPKTVLLAHNGSASILIAYSDVVHDGERSCPNGTEILVRVPGDQTWIPVLARTNACAHGALEESPFLAGKRHAG